MALRLRLRQLKNSLREKELNVVVCEKERPACAPPAALAPYSGVSVGFFADSQPLLKPVQNFFLNPSHSVRAKLHPQGELTGLFQSGDVLWRVQNQLLELTL